MDADDMDPYKVLGLENGPEATPVEIKKVPQLRMLAGLATHAVRRLSGCWR